ncbi:MAG TPA: class I SAM-dependent methyltransferase [Patescibacteria group bacterium]|nr:class I SAM-dependent methyltransferase [Patescibacteria group bacterium]
MAEKVQTNTPCCVCDSTKSTEYSETTYPEYNYPGVFALRKCSECGLLFNSPGLKNEDVFKLYGSNYYFFNRRDDVEFDRIVEMHSLVIKPQEHLVSSKKVLEVGSAKGYLLAVLKTLGWETQGVEISENAARYAREKFGLNIFNGTLEQYAEKSTEKYPLVLGIDVLEHVPDPASFITAAAKLVEEGGILVIDTPNANSGNIKLNGKKWSGFNPFHIFIFNEHNIRQLLKKHGFEVEKAFSHSNSPVAPKRNSIFKKLIRSIEKVFFALNLLGALRKLTLAIQRKITASPDLLRF